MHRNLRTAIPSPATPPPPLSFPEVKRKKGNFYENLTQIVFCEVTLNYAKLCNLIIFFASVKGNG